MRSFAETRVSTTFGSRTDPPLATSFSARTSSSRLATRSFNRYRARRPVLEQLVRVGLLGELRQDDDPDVGMVGPDAPGRVDALGRVRRWHPDVGEDGLGLQFLDGRHELVERARRADQLHLVGRLEQRGRPLSHEVVILREDHAHHARIVQTSERRAA